ncbi:MAG: protein translocase subunit SecF, partial [Desulfobacterales bacterium]
MQFIKPDININFVGKRKIAFLISLAMILVSIASLLIHKGPRYGIDFAGGTLIQVKFNTPASLNRIKTGLATIDLGKSSVQQFGDQSDNEYLIRPDMSVMTSQGFSSKV